MGLHQFTATTGPSQCQTKEQPQLPAAGLQRVPCRRADASMPRKPAGPVPEALLEAALCSLASTTLDSHVPQGNNEGWQFT